MHQSQRILRCVALVILDNSFKYLLQCYLADNKEIAGKYARKKTNILCFLIGKVSSLEIGK